MVVKFNEKFRSFLFNLIVLLTAAFPDQNYIINSERVGVKKKPSHLFIFYRVQSQIMCENLKKSVKTMAA